jgi:hypothetical protein
MYSASLNHTHQIKPSIHTLVFTHLPHGSRTSLSGLCTPNSPCTITHISLHCWFLSYHSLSLHPHRRTSCILLACDCPGRSWFHLETNSLIFLIGVVWPLHRPQRKQSSNIWNRVFTEQLHSNGQLRCSYDCWIVAMSLAVSVLQALGTLSSPTSCYDIADGYQRWDRSVLVRESGCFAVTVSRYSALANCLLLQWRSK